MKPVPSEVTPEALAEHSHIPDWEVRRDIADTEAEIHREERRIEYHQQCIDQLRATNEERRQFNDYLRKILAARAEARPT